MTSIYAPQNFCYDGNKGSEPKLGDMVMVHSTLSDMDGICGVIGGWYGEAKLIALVKLEDSYHDFTVVAMPVVCLSFVKETQ